MTVRQVQVDVELVFGIRSSVLAVAVVSAGAPLPYTIALSTHSKVFTHAGFESVTAWGSRPA